MYFKESVILLLLITTLFVAVNGKSFGDDNTSFSLLSLMARSNDVMQRNPLRSTECFNYYIPLIDEIAKSYQQNHDTCLQTARDGRSEVEAATQDKRNALAASATSSCELLNQCTEISPAAKVFECYAEGGATNSKSMYVINVNAVEHLSDLQEEYRLVENREYRCTNETKRQYEKDSSKAYEDFNKCILGIIEVPTSTAAPVEPESTEEPESTVTPEESTQAPVDPETPESTVSPIETTEDHEDGSGSDEISPQSKLPEEDLSFRH